MISNQGLKSTGVSMKPDSIDVLRGYNHECNKTKNLSDYLTGNSHDDYALRNCSGCSRVDFSRKHGRNPRCELCQVTGMFHKYRNAC